MHIWKDFSSADDMKAPSGLGTDVMTWPKYIERIQIRLDLVKFNFFESMPNGCVVGST